MCQLLKQATVEMSGIWYGDSQVPWDRGPSDVFNASSKTAEI